ARVRATLRMSQPIRSLRLSALSIRTPAIPPNRMYGTAWTTRSVAAAAIEWVRSRMRIGSASRATSSPTPPRPIEPVKAANQGWRSGPSRMPSEHTNEPGVAARCLRVCRATYRKEVPMGQVNVNPPSSGGPVVIKDDGGFGAGMIIGIILLILIVLVLMFYAVPQIFNPGTKTRSFLDL